MENENFTNQELIRAVGKLEGKMDMMVASVDGLAKSFESLEKGRLSRLEIQFAELVVSTKDKAEDIAKATALRTSIWASICTGLIVTIIGGTILYYLKPH